MRVLVCGSREWTDYDILACLLDGLDIEANARGEPFQVIHGCARGADTMAGEWFYSSYGRKADEYPAEWDKYGKSAGYRRNAQMLEKGKPDVVLAFGRGKGTDMMVELARKKGVPVYRVTKEVIER